MKVFHYPVFGISADRIWFSEGERYPSKSQILRYMRIPVDCDCFKGKCVSRDYNDTLIHDLTQTEDEIWKKISKTYRYDINRGKKDEDVCFEIYDSADLSSEAGRTILRGMREAYQKLYEQKAQLGMHYQYSQDQIELFADNNALFISRAYCANAQIWHMYLADADSGGDNCLTSLCVQLQERGC